MSNIGYSLKRFFTGTLGRIVLITLLYLVVFGVIFAVASISSEPTVAVIFAIAFIYFGWKALSKITPEMFVIMPVGGWIAYFLIKGFLSLFLGLFVAPFTIGKWLAGWISTKLAYSLAHETKSMPENSNSMKKGIFSEYQAILESLSSKSEDELIEMHNRLLVYVRKSPVPMPGENYLAEQKKFENSPIEDGGIYGCKTYGEAMELNRFIVSILDSQS